MPRVQLALNASDIDDCGRLPHQAVWHQASQLRSGYANSAIAGPPLTLALLGNRGNGAPSATSASRFPAPGMVGAQRARLAGTGLAPADEQDTTRCYARQGKFWVAGPPDGERWEIYTVLAGSQAC